MKVKFTGVNELRVALDKKTDLKAVKRVVKHNGAQLKRGAQRNAPVSTGFLKRSIGLEFSNGGLTATCDASASYAPYQEWGTRRMQAHPFMRPAFSVQKMKFISDLEKLTK